MPLESQTVRFLDNFSAGTRGSISAEHFIANGYAVIFLHRQWSLEPYTRHYTHSKNCFLDLLKLDNGSVKVDTEHLEEIKRVMALYQHAKDDNLLLKVNFTTVSQYLFLLRGISKLMSVLGSDAMFYLAAAVSDFFIPAEKIHEHKIQSGDHGLHLDLDQVPKILSALVNEWAVKSFIVSFKLETDKQLLVPKSKEALARYGHSVVVANVLTSRKYVVWLVEQSSEEEIRMNDQDISNGTEIEFFIIHRLIILHANFQNKMS